MKLLNDQQIVFVDIIPNIYNQVIVIILFYYFLIILIDNINYLKDFLKFSSEKGRKHTELHVCSFGLKECACRFRRRMCLGDGRCLVLRSGWHRQSANASYHSNVKDDRLSANKKTAEILLCRLGWSGFRMIGGSLFPFFFGHA